MQTVKDLAKPWSALLSKPSADAPPSPQLSIASTPRDSSVPSSPARPSDEPSERPAEISLPQAHSALTTLLLDDSPRKAELQPFNHVCIGEYTGELRAKDVESLQKEQEWAGALEAREQLDAIKANAAPENVPLPPDDESAQAPDVTEDADANPDGPSGDSVAAESSKKRKRREKKLQKRAARLEELAEGGKPDVSYDETLLAVVGVLSEIKTQANVAAWIRTGGLWGARGPPPTDGTSTAKPSSEDPPAAATSKEAEEDAGAESDSSTLSVQKADKRQRMRGPSAEAEVAGNDEEMGAPTPAAEQVQTMWFEDAEVMAYWTGRGRQALEELGIPVEHGLEN